MNKKGEDEWSRKERPPSRVVPALKANLARISSRTSTQAYSAPKPSLTLPEAEALLRSRTEPLPAMILRDVLKLRDHTRYFLMTHGHADVFDLQMDTQGGSRCSMPKEHAVHEDLKQLLDEIAEEEGLEERSKLEVWDDAHARKVSFSSDERMFGVNGCSLFSRRSLYLVLKVRILLCCQWREAVLTDIFQR